MPDACNDRSVSDVPSDPIVSSPIREDHNDDMPVVGDDEPSISLPQVIYLLFLCLYLSYLKSITYNFKVD